MDKKDYFKKKNTKLTEQKNKFYYVKLNKLQFIMVNNLFLLLFLFIKFKKKLYE